MTTTTETETSDPQPVLSLLAGIGSEVGDGQDMSWWQDAECRGTDPDLFFPERGASLVAAKAVCADCSVADECLAFGLYEKFGIWGGLSERERRVLRRRLPKTPRPRQAAACGTLAGYRRHLREGTPTCVGCRRANVLNSQLRKERRSA
jgi:WhiB family redox-sensing transcriptional regulator